MVEAPGYRGCCISSGEGVLKCSEDKDGCLSVSDIHQFQHPHYRF